MIGKIIRSVVGSFMLLVLVFYGLGTLGALPHKFVGEEVFTTFEEAQVFQAEVVQEAERVGASIRSFDLSISSSPKVRYEVYMPGDSKFKYGERLISFGVIGLAQGLTSLVILWVLVSLNIYTWKER